MGMLISAHIISGGWFLRRGGACTTALSLKGLHNLYLNADHHRVLGQAPGPAPAGAGLPCRWRCGLENAISNKSGQLD